MFGAAASEPECELILSTVYISMATARALLSPYAYRAKTIQDLKAGFRDQHSGRSDHGYLAMKTAKALPRRISSLWTRY